MKEKDLRSKIAAYRKIVEEAEGRIRKVRLELALLTCPYNIGDELVEYKKGTVKRRAIITEITSGSYSDNWSLKGVWIKKDNTPSEHIRELIVSNNWWYVRPKQGDESSEEVLKSCIESIGLGGE